MNTKETAPALSTLFSELADGPHEVRSWLAVLENPRDVNTTELSGLIASIAHLAYHLGAIRQIDQSARGPREGTF